MLAEKASSPGQVIHHRISVGQVQNISYFVKIYKYRGHLYPT